MCQQRLLAFLGIFVALYNMVWCSSVIMYNIYVPLYVSHSMTGVDYIFILFTVVSLFLTFISYFRVCSVPPGVPPHWLAEALVEAFVREVLRDIARSGSRVVLRETAAEPSYNGAVTTPIALTDTVADEQINTNRGSSAAQEGRNELTGNDILGEVPMTELREDTEDHETVKTTIHDSYEPPQEASNPAETSARDMALAAAEALEAMGRSRESFEQEMSFLLGDARHCRFCRIYKLDDTHHCSTCRKCVRRMDQHCPLFGKCVGYNNHKFMLLFVFYATITGILLLGHAYLVVNRWNLSLFSSAHPGIFVFATLTTSAFVFVLGVLFAQSIVLLLRGEGMIRVIRTEERNVLAAQRRETHGGTFSILLDDDTAEAPRNSIRFSNLRRTFGSGPVFPWWFLPILPEWPTAESQEETFRTAQRERIEQQIRILSAGSGAANGEEIAVSSNSRDDGGWGGKR